MCGSRSGRCRWSGKDDKYPKDVKGNSVEPTKFTIRAEKCPNRRGVEAVLKHFQGSVLSFANVVKQPVDAMWFAGGYPDPAYVAAAIPAEWKAPPLLVVQDLFPTPLSAAATYVLPATSAFEKDGTFVNHAGLAQTFTRAVRPPLEAPTELQLPFDLLGRRGLVQAASDPGRTGEGDARVRGAGREEPTGKRRAVRIGDHLRSGRKRADCRGSGRQTGGC